MAEDINKESVKEPLGTAAEISASDGGNGGAATPQSKPAADGRRRIAGAPSWWDVVAIVLLFVLSQGVAGAVCHILGIGVTTPVAGDADSMEAASYLQGRYTAVMYFISMAVCLPLLWYYRGLRGWKARLSFRAPGWASPFRLLCGYALLWCVTIAVEPLSSMLPQGRGIAGSGGWLLVSSVLLAPLFEEIVFRGYVAGVLRSAYGGVAAWIGSAVVFGLVHITPSVAVNAAFCGLVLGFYYLRYRSLVLVIMLHAMNNLTACFLRTIGLGDSTLRDVAGRGDAYVVIYSVCLVISVLAAVRMFQLVRRVKSDNYRSAE